MPHQSAQKKENDGLDKKMDLYSQSCVLEAEVMRQEKENQGEGNHNWEPCSWHCPNCGTMVIGYRNEKNVVKAKCRKCRADMIRISRNRRHDIIEIFAPKE